MSYRLRHLPFPPSSLYGLGDSITARGNTPVVAPNYTPVGPVGAWSFGMWASLYSNGALPFGGVAATSGYVTSDIRAIHLPSVLAARPGYCTVLGGINDINTSTALATTKANLSAMWTALADVGVIPVLCSLLPSNTWSTVYTAAPQNPGIITQLNGWIRRQAQLNGWPFVDFYSPLADSGTGGYSGATNSNSIGPYNADDTHPSSGGAKVMGQAVANALSGLSHWSAFLLTNNIDNKSGITNPLFLTDSNADGLPDGWATVSGTITGGTTYQLLTDSGVVGKFFQVQRGADNVTVKTSAGVTIAVGDRLYLGCRIGATVPANGTIEAVVVTNNGEVLCGLQAWDTTIPLSTLALEIQVPTGTTGTTAYLRLGVSGASTTQVRCGQATLVNLTTGLMVS